MDKILEMMRGWPPLGQGIFLLIVLGQLLTFITHGMKYGVALVRGWPPECQCQCDEESDDET